MQNMHREWGIQQYLQQGVHRCCVVRSWALLSVARRCSCHNVQGRALQPPINVGNWVVTNTIHITADSVLVANVDDEPDLWQKSLSDEIQLWIELGLPSEKRLKKASGRAQSVIVYTYGAGSAEQWWKQMQSPLSRFNNIQIFHIDESITNALSTYIQRNIEIQVTIQDAEIHITLGENSLSFTPQRLT